ncbi:MAG: tetratricopeptide repeat protein [Dongiaceae bacterium]
MTRGSNPKTNPMAEAMGLHQSGRLAEAERAYRALLAAAPDYAPALSYLGLLECNTGRPDGLRRLERAVQLAPNVSVLWLNLALTLADRGAADRAEPAFRQALSLDPDLYEALIGLANLLRSAGRHGEAIAAFRRGIAAAPARVDAYVNLGGLLNDDKRFGDAREILERGLQQASGHAALNFNLAMVEANENRTEVAIGRFETAGRGQPGYAMAAWHAALTLPIIYEQQDDIARWRQRWSDNLTRLAEQLDLSNRDAIEAAFRAVWSATNFHLHYQGHDDRDLQRRYAELIGRIVAARFPAFAEPLAPQPMSGRVRVGFMSHFFRHHSIAKTHGAWMTALDRSRFEIFAIHTGLEQDDMTARLRASVEHFLHRPRIDQELFVFVRGLGLDALIYPDIGMEPAYQVLAALRLAPLQCNGLGHPVTSGFAAIDVALSSQAMEPPGADSHYSEKLVPLTHLGFSYRRPAIDPAVEFDRGGATLVYVCPQNLSKLLPDQDQLFARIAAQLPDAVFWFVAGDAAPVTRQFAARLGRAFERFGARPDGRIRLLPRMDQQSFYAMYRAADVYLDSHAWSGCNTSFEALACGLPVVTWPGAMMRGRHSAAILRQAGLDPLVTDSADGYVDLAVRLGRDKPWRREIARLAQSNSTAIFDDPAPLESLARFLTTARDRA